MIGAAERVLWPVVSIVRTCAAAGEGQRASMEPQSLSFHLRLLVQYRCSQPVALTGGKL